MFESAHKFEKSEARLLATAGGPRWGAKFNGQPDRRFL